MALLQAMSETGGELNYSPFLSLVGESQVGVQWFGALNGSEGAEMGPKPV